MLTTLLEWQPWTDIFAIQKKETPVVLVFKNPLNLPILAEIRTEIPGWDETFKEYDYLADLADDGYDIEEEGIAYWAYLKIPGETK